MGPSAVKKKFTQHKVIKAIILFSLFTLTACGGGGSNDSSQSHIGAGNGSGSTTGLTWVSGTFADHADLKNQCAADSSGSEMAEKMWLRSFSDDTYLWYDEIPDQDPAPFSVLDYFDELKTSALTPSGNEKDRFHFSMSSEEWQELSSSGASVGFGFNIAIEQGDGIERKITITYSEPNTPATEANIIRGAVIVEINGASVAANDSASIEALNEGLFPSESGQQATFKIQDLASLDIREVTLTAETIISDPVPLVKSFASTAGKVGYVVFNDHIATAERGLYDVFNQLETENIDELIIDFRYNGGGYLAIASQLGYMVGGTNTLGKTFEKLIFNDKYPSVNPITGRTLSPTPFYDETVGLNDVYISAGFELPTLNLSRVIVLTSAGTCSASESFMNGMLGANVEVIQIGSTTCGKPYGFYAADNCETTYFTVQFKGENNLGFGDYADGFSPSETPMLDTEIQGCPVTDDLTKALGDPQEGMFSTAMHYLENGQCPTMTTAETNTYTVNTKVEQGFAVQDKRARSQFSANRILTR